jgi:hypothetical protein
MKWLHGTAKAEYLPKKAYENRFYIATRDKNIYTLQGKAVIEKEKKEGNKLEAKLTILEDGTIFELPYIYYPGYEIRLDGTINRDTFETENGFLGLKLDKDIEVELEVRYSGTKIMNMSNLISFISLIVFGVYIWKKEN